MKLMGSRELLSLWVAVFAVVWSVLGAVSEEVVRKSSKVHCFVGTSWFPTIPCYQLMQRCTCINFAVALVVIGLDFSYREVS